MAKGSERPIMSMLRRFAHEMWTESRDSQVSRSILKAFGGEGGRRKKEEDC